MQALRRYAFSYNQCGKGIVVPYDGDPDAEYTVLKDVESVLGEKGPVHVNDDTKLLRAVGNVIEELDVETETFLSPTKMVKKDKDIDCFSQNLPNLIEAVGDQKVIVVDKRESKGTTYEDVSTDKGIHYELMKTVKDSNLIAAVGFQNRVLVHVWLRRDAKRRTLVRYQELHTLTGNFFNLLTDFQVERHQNYVISTFTGYNCTSKLRTFTSADKNPESAFVGAMLYDVGSGTSECAMPVLIAKIKCVPPPGKKGSPDVNPPFPVRFWSDQGKTKVRVYAKWNSDNHLVFWDIDVEKITRDSLETRVSNVVEIRGEHVASNRSMGLNFDKTLAIKASSMDPNCSAGFVMGANGRAQVFTITENAFAPRFVASQIDGIVETYKPVELNKQPIELHQAFDSLCVEEKDPSAEITLAGISGIFDTARNYLFGPQK